VRHILIVDDDPAIRNVVADILEVSDYSVRMATNGIEALRELRAHPPAVVLLDLMMPVMDGWEFLRQIKHAAIRVPVAVMSAARDAGTVSDELGAQAFLPKPFERDDVLLVVDRLAGTRHRFGGPC
jgi:CheY-like chemotaxis protein